MRASSSAMRRIDAACCSGLSVKAGQPASKRGQVAIASPGEQQPALGPGEREVAGRVAGHVEDLQRAERVAVADALVDRDRPVLRPVEEDPDLERVGAERRRRLQADGLGRPVAGDDVRLPLVREHGRTGRPLQRGQAAEVRAVRVREHDPLQVGGLAAELAGSRRARHGRRSRRACRRARARRSSRSGRRGRGRPSWRRACAHRVRAPSRRHPLPRARRRCRRRCSAGASAG